MKIKEYQDRLRQFADYLKAGNLICTEFYNDLVATKSPEEQKKDECLMGLYYLPLMELPMIFSDWRYNENYLPIYKGNPDKQVISSVNQYFGISDAIFKHLFCPGKQQIKIWGGRRLLSKPTPLDVANNIYAYIEHLNRFTDVKANHFKINLN